MRHFLDLLDTTTEELQFLIAEASHLKNCQASERTPALLGRVLGLVFDKPSLRTRVSFQAAMAQLGGSSIFLSGQESGLGSRESMADFARVLSQYVDAIVLRTFSHNTVETFAAHSACPVINGLSDAYHPCQALADVLTMQEIFGDIRDLCVVFVGDGNNVARSLAICCGKLGARFVLAAPLGYGFSADFLERYRDHVCATEPLQETNPDRAVASADIIYTDVWTSMGQESERDERALRFRPYQVNAQLLEAAPLHARVMHCLPARRGEEVTGEILDGERSIIFQQAGNRLHAQKALLQWLLESPRPAPVTGTGKPPQAMLRQPKSEPIPPASVS
jgi:ornithine carbamoyltransferase